MNKPIIIDDCNILKARKFLIHTDKYSIGEDGLIDNTIPLTDICYDLALQLQQLKAENERLKAFKRECLKPVYLPDIESEVINKYKQALEDVREITKRYYLSDKKLLATGIGINPYGAIIEIQNKVNEVLK